MEKHKMAGKPVKLTGGRYKGVIFTAIDYLVNQFQGKRIEKIAKGHPELFVGIHPDDIKDTVVIGTLHNIYENHVPKRVVVRDQDLMKELLSIVDGGQEAAPVIPLRPEEVENVTSGPSSSDNQDDVTRGPESDGRSVSGGEVHGGNVLPLKQQGEADRASGSGDSGLEAEHSRSCELEAGPSEPTPIGKGKPKK